MKIYVSVGISTLFLLEYYHCYENICRRNSTTVLQSSTYDNQQETLAIDGDLRTKYRYCAHTDVNQTVAWLQVDLGKPYSISNVTLYYRKDGLGNNEWQPYRFRQFYLDVSDLPASQKTTAHRTRCYTDNTTHPDVLPHIIDIPCKHTARYVIVETTYDAPEDDPTTGAILEICEIEVYGCETGEYDDDCKPCSECKTCDVNNGICDCFSMCINQTCDGTSGHCTFGCETGYWGSTCASLCPDKCQDRKCFRDNGLCKTCEPGHWGIHCNHTCSSFCNKNICNQSNGGCSKGCIMGRYGDTCDNACSPGCVHRSCDSQSASCSEGCHQNWMGTRCDSIFKKLEAVGKKKNCEIIGDWSRSISNHTYWCAMSSEGDGELVFQKWCSILNHVCNVHEGHGNKFPRCEHGDLEDRLWIKKGCDSTHYGLNCSKSCNLNCTIGCTKDTGVCYSCVEGKFGEYCDKTCGAGCVSGCDQYTGQCVCKLGWQSDRCEDCSPYHYGVNCHHKCSSNCLYGTCYRNNGTCKGGCKCSVIEELSLQVQHIPKSNMETIHYVVTGLLGLSLLLNMLFILRKIKCKVCENTAEEDSTSVQMISRVSCNETYYLNPIELINEDRKEESCICEEEVDGCPEPHYAHIQKTSDKNTDGQTCEKEC